MKKVLFVLIAIFSFSAYAGSGDWSESHGGDGIVSEFIMIARSMVSEMEREPALFDKALTVNLKQSINETIVSSADKLVLDGVEKDAINHTLEKPYRIEVSRNRWLQYESSIETQEKLVLHEYLFTLHIDDSDYMTSNSLYRVLLSARMSNDDNRLGSYLLKGAENCNLVKVNTLISLGVNLNSVDEDNRNALFMAASSGCEELVTKFLDYDVPDLLTAKNSWNGWYAAFVASLRKENTPEQFKRYLNILKGFFRYILDADQNKIASFDTAEFPEQENYCKGQTMFMRSLIGVKVYTDETKSKTEVLRNLKVVSLFKSEQASLDLKDECGKSAKDYAQMYNIDLKKL